jgi:GNAT superfamily N-acetyltransferase
MKWMIRKLVGRSDEMDDGGIKFQCVPSFMVPAAVQFECATLFSEHYGVWGCGAPKRQGLPIRLSPDRLRSEYLFDDDCRLATARRGADGQLVGYAIARCFCTSSAPTEKRDLVIWITQMVVRAGHRNRGVATRLCDWITADREELFACGIVSANPYAVRAMERAMNGPRCDVSKGLYWSKHLIRESKIPYVQGKLVRGTAIDTAFFVDRSDTVAATEAEPVVDWQLGEIRDGQEYFAFVFF